ncbi:MAG: glycosyltransferase [Prevotellaceae bacterium]|nr:glycosyltransferase [Prevotellaceae bacterium]
MTPSKVSIIVPVYNAGKHFTQCLDSLVNQTLREIEIILVLDLPADGSDRVAEQYAQRDSRIKLIYNEINLHIGKSRNRGMEQATGKYIGFVDHDDYCQLEMFEWMYQKAEGEHSDIVCCNYIKEQNGTQQYPQSEYIPSSENRENFIRAILRAETGGEGCLWNKLFRNNFLKQNQIQFIDTKLSSGEDYLFVLNVFFCTSKISYLPQNLYHWVTHTHNTGNTDNYHTIEKNIINRLNIFAAVNENKPDNAYYFDFLTGTGQYIYSPFFRALKERNFADALHIVATIKNSEIYCHIKNIFKREYLSVLLQWKPTIGIFFIILRIIPQKRRKHEELRN